MRRRFDEEMMDHAMVAKFALGLSKHTEMEDREEECWDDNRKIPLGTWLSPA